MTALDNASIAAMLADLDSQVVSSQGYTRGELKAAFDAVANRVNWKLSIRSLCQESDREITAEAIKFFAGCEAEFIAPPAEVAAQGWVEVRAEGYYAAVGA